MGCSFLKTYHGGLGGWGDDGDDDKEEEEEDCRLEERYVYMYKSCSQRSHFVGHSRKKGKKNGHLNEAGPLLAEKR